MTGKQRTHQLICSIVILFCLLDYFRVQGIICLNEKLAKIGVFKRKDELTEITDECTGCTTIIYEEDEVHTEQRVCSKETEIAYNTFDRIDVLFDPNTKKTMKKKVERRSTCYEDLCNNQPFEPLELCSVVKGMSSNSETISPKLFLIIPIILVLNNIFAFLFHL
ncbi:unnamed protein product [Calicophoron daubneyi]|uniref:Uncharacterized protein n=1 Tax=Calicophoron daubneyi TaxID=300641 RepID=A0AAV2TW57_CALDB